MADNKSNGSVKRVLYIIISIVASIALWSYVTYVENPDMPLTKSNISVEYIGADVLKENNLVVISTDTDSLTLTFSGKRNTVMRLDDAFITATVDLSDIVELYSATAGVYQLEYSLDYGGAVSQSAVSISNTSKNYVTVTVEKLSSETVPVKVKNNVKTAEGFITDKEELSVAYVEVTGPQSELSKIKAALVEITREDISKPLEENVPFVLVDANDNPVTSAYITTDVTAVTVTIPVLMVKEVPLKVSFVETTAAKESTAAYEITPKYITIAGKQEDVEGINEIVIGSVDLSSFALETTKLFNITVPDDIKNVSGEATAKADIKLPSLKTKTVNVSDVQIRGIPAGKSAEVVDPVVQIMLRSTPDILGRINSANIRVVADLTGVNTDAGNVSVVAKVYLDNITGVDVIGECKVEITVKNAE